MSAILRNIPDSYDWGWNASHEDPRMHLQTMSDQPKKSYKVWLEKGGRRVIEPASPIPAKVLKALVAAVTDLREPIEDSWASFMIEKGWLKAHLKTPEVVLVAYPGLPGSFTRSVDLTTHLSPSTLAKLTQQEITLSSEISSLQLFTSLPEARRTDIKLSTYLWQNKPFESLSGNVHSLE